MHLFNSGRTLANHSFAVSLFALGVCTLNVSCTMPALASPQQKAPVNGKSQNVVKPAKRAARPSVASKSAPSKPASPALQAPVMNADTAALENASNTSRVHQLLPDGTPVKLELQDQLKGNKVELGQEVRYLVAEDVKDASGRVLIAKGAQAGGEVLDCKKAKKFGKSSELTFSASWVEASDGSRLPLNFRFTKEARNKGLIRFNSFLNPFGKGGDAKVKKGTQFTALVGQAPPELPTVTSADTKQVKTASDSPVETARPNSSNPSVSPASQR